MGPAAANKDALIYFVSYRLEKGRPGCDHASQQQPAFTFFFFQESFITQGKGAAYNLSPSNIIELPQVVGILSKSVSKKNETS